MSNGEQKGQWAGKTVQPQSIPRASGLEAMAGEKQEIARRQAQLDDKPLRIMPLDLTNARYLLTMPSDQPVSMTTHNNRVIICQGNRIYELKHDELDDQYTLHMLGGII